jgi:hypothetical protein
MGRHPKPFTAADLRPEFNRFIFIPQRCAQMREAGSTLKGGKARRAFQ